MAEWTDDGACLLAHFDNADDLLRAVTRLREEGYRLLEGYTPFPVDGLAEALHFEERRLPRIALMGAVFGGAGGMLMLWYLNAYDFPINVGGRPLDAWAAFALPAFEMLVLFAVLSVIGAMLWFNGLPRLHHPLFDARGFERVSSDRFLLAVGRADPIFDAERSGRLLEELGAVDLEMLAP